MASLASINIRFAADLAGFSTQMQNAERQLQKVSKNLQRVGSQLTVGLTLPILGIGIASVKAASDAEETASKFNVVFRDIAGSAETSFDTLRNEYGLSANASKQLLGDTGDLLTGFGFSQRAALDLSTEVNKLAVDLASFTNFSGGAEGASQALTKALLGERESVKSLGISILEEDVKKQVALNTAKGLTFETERQAKAYATLDLALAQSQNAIGDYERTSGSFANQMRLVQARLSDLAVSFGEVVLPVVTSLASKMVGLIDRFNNLSPATKKLIVVLAGIAAAVGPLLALAGTILPAIVTGFALLTGPIGLIIAGLTAVGIIIYKNWAPIKKTLIDIANYFIDLYNESTVFRIGIEAVTFQIKNLFEVGKFAFETLKNIVGSFIDNFVNGFKTIGAVFKAAITGNISAIPGIIKNSVDESKNTFAGFTDELAADWSNLTDGIKQNGKDAIDAITKRNKIEFLKEDVDASGVKEAVTDAVVSGVTNGLAAASGAGGRAKTQSLDTGGLQSEGVTLQSPLAQLSTDMPEQFAIVDSVLVEWQARLADFNENATAIVQSTAENFAVGFANIIGGIATGVNPLAAIGKLILTTVGDLLQQLGKAAIQIGITMKSLKLSFSSPLAAIAAGAAAIVLGGLIKSLVPKDLQRFQDGGIVGGNSFYGDKILARVNSGELILNQDQQKQISNALDQQPAFALAIEGQWKLAGEDMKLALDRSNQSLSRQS